MSGDCKILVYKKNDELQTTVHGLSDVHYNTIDDALSKHSGIVLNVALKQHINGPSAESITLQLDVIRGDLNWSRDVLRPVISVHGCI